MITPFLLLQPASILRPVALVLVVLLAFCVLTALGETPILEHQDEKFQRTFSVVSPSILTVDNLKGTIHVTGTDGDKVLVSVYKKFRGREKDKKWWMEQTKVEFQNDRGHVSVKVDYPDRNCDDPCKRGFSSYTASVELEIEVPRQTSVQLNGHKPEISVSSIQGDITINSHKSPITIQSATGSIQIRTFKDAVKLTDVAITGVLDISNDKGTVMIDAKSLGKEVRLETDKGAITLRMPRHTGADVDFVGGRNSSFHSAFKIGGGTVGHAVREIRGTINQGGTKMSLRTNKGSISLEAAS